MAGPTALDLPQITEIRPDDVLYGIRGTIAGRDRQFDAELLFQSSIIINTQAEFERYFGDGTEVGTGTTGGGWDYSESGGNVTITMPKNTYVYLKSNPSDGVTTHYKYDATLFPIKAYSLKTKIKLQTADKIDGSGIDQAIMIKGNNFAGFITESLVGATDNITSWATNVFTMDSTPLAEVFKPGMVVFNSIDDAPYTVIAQSGATVTVDKTITGASGNASLFACQDSIEVNGFTFDGRCGIDGLGGSLTGRAFYLQYCSYSIFKCKVINFKVITGNFGGAAYRSDFSVYNLKISNIYNCDFNTAAVGLSYGGACFGCNYCNISNIYNCNITVSTGGISHGGACSNCSYSQISNIYNCSTGGSSEGGGACGFCNYSKISNIFDCRSSGRGGACGFCNYSQISNIYNCTAANTGGACSFCNYSKISNIYNCTAGVGAGGCQACNYSQISNIYNCTAPIGGACNACLYCDISMVENCSPLNATGAAINNCNQCTFNGTFYNSDDVGPPPRLIRSSVSCAWNIVHDGTPRQATGTPGF